MHDLSVRSSLHLSLLLSSFNVMSLSIHPTDFLSSLDLNHDLSGRSRDCQTNVDGSCNQGARIVDLTGCLHCQVAVLTAITRVEIAHM